jgi:hypothetical protein
MPPVEQTVPSQERARTSGWLPGSRRVDRVVEVVLALLVAASALRYLVRHPWSGTSAAVVVGARGPRGRLRGRPVGAGAPPAQLARARCACSGWVSWSSPRASGGAPSPGLRRAAGAALPRRRPRRRRARRRRVLDLAAPDRPGPDGRRRPRLPGRARRRRLPGARARRRGAARGARGPPQRAGRARGRRAARGSARRAAPPVPRDPRQRGAGPVEHRAAPAGQRPGLGAAPGGRARARPAGRRERPRGPDRGAARGPRPRSRGRAGRAARAVLQRLAEQATRGTGLPGGCSCRGSPVPLPHDVETALLRTARGALANVVEHARATQAVVTLTYLDDRVSLDVCDDAAGCGGPWPPGDHPCGRQGRPDRGRARLWAIATASTGWAGRSWWRAHRASGRRSR